MSEPLFVVDEPMPPIAEPQRVTERHMLDMLAQRYTRVSMDAHRYAYAEHVPDRFASRIADFIAVDCWMAQRPRLPLRYEIHGHEVKVSRADWLAELRDPTKAAAFTPYVHRWWLVVSDRSIVRPGELPTGWGLLAKRRARGLRYPGAAARTASDAARDARHAAARYCKDSPQRGERVKRTELRRSTPLRASSSLLRGSGLAPASPKRAKRGRATDIPATVRQAVHARSGGLCECGCGRRAQHVHHRKLRSQGGRHEPANLVDLSLHCHTTVHANPERSYALGLLVHSWCDPADIPVTRTETAA